MQECQIRLVTEIRCLKSMHAPVLAMSFGHADAAFAVGFAE